MRSLGSVAQATLAIAIGAGCNPLPFTAEQLECDTDTPRPLCEGVARAAVGATDRDAIGPIEAVSVESVDCLELDKSIEFDFYRNAVRCWRVEVIGADTRDPAIVHQMLADGPLEVLRP